MSSDPDSIGDPGQAPGAAARTQPQPVPETTPAKLRPGLGIALRKTFRDGYGRRELRADLLAGAVVAIMALPLSMALAVAVGAPPEHGLYTAIVGGALIAALGGSRVQVSGPTAAFVVVLAPITAQFGLGGLLLATMMVAPWFGGIAATGAIARTATNVRAGGRSPIAAISHSAYLLIVMLLAAPLLGWLPMTSLAAILLV